MTVGATAPGSGSIVVDIPYGLGGGLGIYGAEVSPHALVQATADGHPRAVADLSWEPATTVNAIKAHPFYRYLVAAEDREEGLALTAAQRRAARQDALRMHVGWAIVWKSRGEAISYLRQVGFTYQYRVGQDRPFRLAPVAGAHRGRTA